jgi:hypothetical protein
VLFVVLSIMRIEPHQTSGHLYLTVGFGNVAATGGGGYVISGALQALFAFP